MTWPNTSDFQVLAPLIITRDPASVRRVLVRRARGELSLAETVRELERITMTKANELVDALSVAKNAYNAAVERARSTCGDRWAEANAVADKNAAWFALDRARSAIQEYLRR